MIQLIGFLLCIYLLVRGLDILSRVEDRKSRSARLIANAAVVIAVISALLFFYLFIEQGSQSPSFEPPALAAPPLN